MTMTNNFITFRDEDTPTPRATLDVAIETKKLTLGTIRHFVERAARFADDAQIVITPEVVRVIQESQKPTVMTVGTGGHLHFEATKKPQPRDAAGRFTKRKEGN